MYKESYAVARVAAVPANPVLAENLNAPAHHGSKSDEVAACSM